MIAVLDTGTDCTHPDFINAGGSSTNTTQGGQLAFALSAAVSHDRRVAGLRLAGRLTDTARTWRGQSRQPRRMAPAFPGLRMPPRSPLTRFSTAPVQAPTRHRQAMMAAADAGVKVISMSLGGQGYSQTLAGRRYLCVAARRRYRRRRGKQQHQCAVLSRWRHARHRRSRHRFGEPKGEFFQLRQSGRHSRSGSEHLFHLADISNPMGGVNYGYLSGTSMATPHVSGAAGLIAMAFPGVSSDAIVQRLQQSAASSIAGDGWNQNFGFGILDAASAVAGVLRSATTGSIVGQVVNGSNLPVGGASVFTDGASVITAGDGLFRLANIAAGKHPVTVTATGFRQPSSRQPCLQARTLHCRCNWALPWACSRAL